MAATITSYSAGDEAAQQIALDALNPAATDHVIVWQQNNLVYVAKIPSV